MDIENYNFFIMSGLVHYNTIILLIFLLYLHHKCIMAIKYNFFLHYTKFRSLYLQDTSISFLKITSERRIDIKGLYGLVNKVLPS